MATLVQSTFQTALPLMLFERMQRIRQRYAAALKAAGMSDYSRAQELRTVNRAVGHLLATEAKKSIDERGGLRMLDISLMVDSFFPELRGWNQHEMRQLHQRRLSSMSGRAS
ncbi:MAG TPA: hypothetical protein VNT75_19460 [Symbiobacteriaceae bacterium]|nr:hypothetical protein [Symbiobacteriaceae bacterium]